MLNKKIATIVIMLLGTTMAIGATTDVIVNGSGIATNAIEAELIWTGQSGSPADMLVVTQARNYCFKDTIAGVIPDSSTHVSGTLSGGGTFDASITNTNPTIWTLQITNDGAGYTGKCNFPNPLAVNGQLRIQQIP